MRNVVFTLVTDDGELEHLCRTGNHDDVFVVIRKNNRTIDSSPGETRLRWSKFRWQGDAPHPIPVNRDHLIGLIVTDHPDVTSIYCVDITEADLSPTVRALANNGYGVTVREPATA